MNQTREEGKRRGEYVGWGERVGGERRDGVYNFTPLLTAHFAQTHRIATKEFTSSTELCWSERGNTLQARTLLTWCKFNFTATGTVILLSHVKHLFGAKQASVGNSTTWCCLCSRTPQSTTATLDPQRWHQTQQPTVLLRRRMLDPLYWH